MYSVWGVRVGGIQKILSFFKPLCNSNMLELCNNSSIRLTKPTSLPLYPFPREPISENSIDNVQNVIQNWWCSDI